MRVSDMFSGSGFRFSMRMQSGDPADYFAPTENHAALLEERARWLAKSPDRHAGLLPEGVPLLGEALDLAATWDSSFEADSVRSSESKPSAQARNGVTPGELDMLPLPHPNPLPREREKEAGAFGTLQSQTDTDDGQRYPSPGGEGPRVRAIPPGPDTGADQLHTLARAWEPDFLLLKPTDAAMPILVGGAVCFPSSWSLEEKMGRSIDFIHEVVPGLNEAIGDKVRNFLNRLRPGVAWLRANWGLSASHELNQHPARGLARLSAKTPPEDIWLRVERQALVALPQSGGVLFGIRVESAPLSEVKQEPAAALALAQDLQTMPEAMARYKNIATVRPRVLEWLAGEGSG